MPAQYANLDGRHWVNEDFVNEVREKYPATTKKIPYGYSTYTGWTGKDEVLFTQHDHLDDEVSFEGPVYEATFDFVAADSFRDKILDLVEHQPPAKVRGEKQAATERIRRQASIDQSWGTTLEERIKAAGMDKQARRGSGLYGFPKPIQAACESAIKRMNRRACALMQKAVKKDKHFLPFLQTHAKRGQSLPARVLLSAYKASLPSLDWNDDVEFDVVITAADKEAGSKYGLYGYPAKTARLGLQACMTMREVAGQITADMHRRKAASYGRITGFLGEHNKTGRVAAAGLLLNCYPDEGFKFRRAAEEAPKSVSDWLTWKPDEG